MNLRTEKHISLWQTGEITIRDISFRKCITLQGPCRWDGIAENGKMVPEGLYMIVNARNEITFLKVSF